MKSIASSIILHLSLIDDIGPAIIERLLARMSPENFADMYHLSASDFHNSFGISSETAQKMVDGLADTNLLAIELDLIDNNGISWATIFDPEYPQLLKNIHLPPIVIYWKGVLGHQDTIAIVGSRAAHSYAQQAIDQLVPALTMQGWAIVSGGARGADTMAHQATLDAGGKTIAVWGSGLLKPYPPENKRLFENIVQAGGAIVSPFPLLLDPLPGNFPARNRVIAGLSRGCIVVQAAIKSGARITADYALSQGREVFAIPGPIDDLLSAGCHALIQQGAKLTTCVNDILIEFGQEIEPEKVEIPVKPVSKRVLQMTFVPVQEEDTSPEGVILRYCRKPCSVDELLESTGLPLIQMTKMLFELQIKGLISQNMAGLWEKQ